MLANLVIILVCVGVFIYAARRNTFGWRIIGTVAVFDALALYYHLMGLI